MTVKLTILGATGTIGVNTLDVVARHADRFEIFALTANANVEGLFEQCQTWNPRYAVMVQEEAAAQLAARCHAAGLATEVLAGTAALVTVAAHAEVDYVMAGIVGAAGLLPNLAAAQAGKRVMLANKESLVMSGHLFMDAVRESGAELLPIDSEHNAVFQCMPADFGRGLPTVGVERILLTASGGPFRTVPLETLRTVTPAQAVAHPNWVMGRKISVDSATMMNKGLEVIEACWLFGTGPDEVEVVIHPQSVIHSMVQYVDGSVLAQLGNPDMRTPIAYSLGWPERVDSGVSALDLFAVRKLDFEEPDYVRFPCLRLAKEAMARGGTAPAILNAANEVAVAAFLDEQIGFTDIPKLVEHALERVTAREAVDLERILADDAAARAAAQQGIRDGVG
ncbi:MAG: 1-deoxy-D-xylulose-5-phosphate reductoisomerase [Gammaproteobacteria bacterium]|nr:1-deoxy-D-xylulose-5-phosphate reductoisomerase [Gammaproteobacteria bacterium]MCP5202026.1 1-deoxy-D-xylulose-5-phosphate reductoisomerase [Gammaproteobacteria bacterium]